MTSIRKIPCSSDPLIPCPVACIPQKSWSPKDEMVQKCLTEPRICSRPFHHEQQVPRLALPMGRSPPGTSLPITLSCSLRARRCGEPGRACAKSHPAIDPIQTPIGKSQHHAFTVEQAAIPYRPLKVLRCIFVVFGVLQSISGYGTV